MASQSPRATGISLSNTFASLRHRNYRLWFFGQTLSLMGTWMQSVAQGWVVYQLTGSELALGTITFIGSAPTLFLLLPAGCYADRLPKRSILLVTQTVMMLLAFIMAGLAATGLLQVWHVAVLAFCLGIANSFDAPARQAMVVDMVEDRKDMRNAIALNSSIINMGRVVGPAIGGLVLASLGAKWCFTLNGISFLAVIVALLMMKFPPFKAPQQEESIMDQIKVGLGYIMRTPLIRTLVAMVGISHVFGFTYSVLMPAYAADALKVGEAGLGTLQAAVGLGALLASLIVASMAHSHHHGLMLTLGSLLFPVALLAAASSRWLLFSVIALGLLGMGWVTQGATANTIVQSTVPDYLRGRVMAVYSLMFFGAQPLNALLAGSLGQAFGVRTAYLLCGGVTLAFGAMVLILVPQLRRWEA